MNQIVLTVSTLEVLPLRYTPVGLPAVQMVLVHSSQVMEAGLTRQVDMTISAIALGDMALLLADTPLGADMTVKGFLAPARKGSSKLVLHIQQAKRAFAGSATAVV